MQTIIIARTDKIGDFVVSIPSYATARAMFPTAHIVALVSKFNRIIAENVPCIDECVCIDDFPVFNDLVAKLRSLHPDVFVALVSNNTISKLAVKSGAPVRIGPRSKLWSFVHYNHGLRQHRSQCLKSEAAYNLDLIERIDPQRFAAVGVCLERIVYSPQEALVVHNYLYAHHIPELRFVLVNPFTGGSGANLSLDQYGMVIDDILAGQNPYNTANKHLVSPSGADIAANADMGNTSVKGPSSMAAAVAEARSAATSSLTPLRTADLARRREFYEDQQVAKTVMPVDGASTLVTDAPQNAKAAASASASASASTSTLTLPPASATSTVTDAATDAGDVAYGTAQQDKLRREEAASRWNEQVSQAEGAIDGDFLARETTGEDGSVTWSWSRRNEVNPYTLQQQQAREQAAAKAAADFVGHHSPQVVILGMPQHKAKMEKILSYVAPERRKYVHFFLNEGSLMVAAALVDCCKVFIGPSTGITQIAGNYQKPVICFYSSRISNSHRRWELYGDPEEVAFTFNIRNLNPETKELSRLQDGMRHALVSTVLEEFYR